MLNSINLDDKSYEDILAEAISQIPLYSDEWTNYNNSDPGITVVQNLSAFSLLQQAAINEITDPIRRNLLRLLGFEAAQDRPARVFAACSAKEPIVLPAHWKCRVGSLCFETEKPVTVWPWGIGAVYTALPGGGYRDITYLLGRAIPVDTAVFGLQPEAGMQLYCALSGRPEPGTSSVFWVQLAKTAGRNPADPRYPVSFSSLRWECYTADGWTELEAEDETDGFLWSGAIRLTFPSEPLVPFEELPQPAFAIRCVLTRAEYDIPPRIHSLTGNLLELVQQETRSACFSFPGGEEVVVHSAMTVYGNFFVCCREEPDGPMYAYQPRNTRKRRGRFYTMENAGDGTVTLRFDRERFGFAPAQDVPDAVLVVCWDEETTYHRSLGPVYGYEDQMVPVELLEHIIPDSFSLLAELTDRQGEITYRLVRPGETDPDQLCYEVLSAPGELRITQPGLGNGCRLFLCSCAVTAGRNGNIREQNGLEPVLRDGLPEGTRFWNPAAGRGGETYESLEEVRLRFAAAMRRPTTAVTAQDYEDIVRRTPGLCIHKVKAVVDEEANSVSIAVKPRSETPNPQLSAVYLQQIRRWLEAHRLLSVRIHLLQPRYVRVNVNATIYVKSYYSNARQEIEAVLNRHLDFSAADRGFGETVSYHQLVRELEQLPCVESVYELFLIPQAKGDMMYTGHDIQMGNHSICRPGQYFLELSTRTGSY